MPGTRLIPETDLSLVPFSASDVSCDLKAVKAASQAAGLIAVNIDFAAQMRLIRGAKDQHVEIGSLSFERGWEDDERSDDAQHLNRLLQDIRFADGSIAPLTEFLGDMVGEGEKIRMIRGWLKSDQDDVIGSLSLFSNGIIYITGGHDGCVERLTHFLRHLSNN